MTSLSRYTFNCKSWIEVYPDFNEKAAKVMKVSIAEESQLTALKSLNCYARLYFSLSQNIDLYMIDTISIIITITLTPKLTQTLS